MSANHPTIRNWLETFDLKPEAQWSEALRICYLPRIPRLVASFYAPEYWQRVENSFARDSFEPEHVFSAAWLLLIDTWLWLHKGFDWPEDSPFSRLAEMTGDVDEPPLRIAHCIRDLAYGDESRTDDLVAMVDSEDPAYRATFERCLWR